MTNIFKSFRNLSLSVAIMVLQALSTPVSLSNEINGDPVSLVVGSKDDGPVFGESHTNAGHWRYTLTFESTANGRGSIELFTIDLFRISPEYHFNVMLFEQAAGLSIAGQLKKSSGGTLAVSGGFLASYDPIRPVGLTKIDGHVEIGRVLPSRDDVLSGIICFDGGKVKILDVYSYLDQDYAISENESCLQAGPVIVSKGAPYQLPTSASSTLQRFTDTPHVRLFMAHDQAAKIYVGITSEVTIGDLSRALTEIMAEELGVHFMNAIHLHGAGNAGIVFRHGEETIEFGSIFAPQATIILGAESAGTD